MYRTFEEEVFLAPETVISGVLEAAVFEDLQELTGRESVRQTGRAADVEPDADGEAAATDGPPVVRNSGDPIDAWSRHARGTNGFGG
jgi:hypothetical protein